MPIGIVQMFARLETRLPERLHGRAFWKIERA
jgi:hypothetical protein